MRPDRSGHKAAARKSTRTLVVSGLCLMLSAFLALFPFGWLGEVWPDFGLWLGRVFATAWAHAIGHMLIFLLAGLAALGVFPVLRARPWAYFGVLCVTAVGQEMFQLLYKQRRPVFDDFRDLVTDLIGMALAFGVVCYLLPLLKNAS